MTIAYPPVILNQYLTEKVPQYLPNTYYGPLRFFPAQPTDLESMTEMFSEESNDVFAVYDRLFRMRRGPFPHIKSEQTIYYFYKVSGAPEALIETTQTVFDLLDRGDESASEVNAWVSSQILDDRLVFGSGSLARTFKPVYFHNIKVFQLEESRDINQFKTTKTFMGSKMMIEYTYHIPQDFNNTPIPDPADC